MSWDVVLFKSSDKISSPENINENALIIEDFTSAFRMYFKNIIVNEGSYSINGNNFSIEYYGNDHELSSNILLSLYGESAIYSLIDLAIKNDWQIYDTALNSMIDLDNPSKNGYKNFQNYLNQILK